MLVRGSTRHCLRPGGPAAAALLAIDLHLHLGKAMGSPCTFHQSCLLHFMGCLQAGYCVIFVLPAMVLVLSFLLLLFFVLLITCWVAPYFKCHFINQLATMLVFVTHDLGFSHQVIKVSHNYH